MPAILLVNSGDIVRGQVGSVLGSVPPYEWAIIGTAAAAAIALPITLSQHHSTPASGT